MTAKSSQIEDVPLVDALAEVFSRYGYEGANLNRLSDASSLKRSSLYHRFPGGKDEIVQAVISRAEDRYTSVLGPAFEDGDPEERAIGVARGLAEYYAKGEASCIIVALSVSDDEGRAQGGRCVLGWADGFARIASDSGMSDADALEAALDAIAVIEGALVISATTGRTGPFERALSELPAQLTTNQRSNKTIKPRKPKMTTSTDATTVLSEVGDHELSVLVFYRGHWCPFCQSYLRELNGEFRNQVQAIGGRVVGITSQSDELAAEAKQAWGLDYDVISDPSNTLAQKFDINITAKAETPMAEHPTEYPNGMSQTGVIVLDRSGEVIYNWAVDPTETNLHGASDRPLPADVWAVIEAHRTGTEPQPTDGRRLDPQFLAENYPDQFAAFEAWVASQSA